MICRTPSWEQGKLQKEQALELHMPEKKECEFQGKYYPNGGNVCIGDQCIQCYDGKWGPNEYELAFQERIIETLKSQ